MDPTVLQIVTLATAVVGAVLGVLNYWRNWVADRVRLRVRVTLALQPDKGWPLVQMVVVNLSRFPVTLDKLGFEVLDGGGYIAAPLYGLPDGTPWPYRLEPRAALAMVVPLPTQQRDGFQFKCGQVQTACGYVHATSRWQMRRLGKQALRLAQP